MIEISPEQIIHIHQLVVKRFNITSGIINKGLLDAVVNRPETKIANKEQFPNVYSKAASLLESIIRWHPFADGNKRTALLTIIYYMQQNGYGVALPLSAVRFTVKIAKNNKTDPKSTKKLLKEITQWLVSHADKDPTRLGIKLTLYISIPYRFVIFLSQIKLGRLALRTVNKWLAFDIYPEYEKEAPEIMQFMEDAFATSLETFSDFKEERKKQSK